MTFTPQTTKSTIMKMLAQSSAKMLLPVCLTLLAISSCNKADNLKDVTPVTETIHNTTRGIKSNTFKGPEVEVGNGYGRTFITMSHDDVPEELGVVLTDEALSGLPATNTPFVLDFHPKALAATPFQHVSLGWSANGHPLPNGAFITTHFDVRFFMMSFSDRLAIPAPP